MTRLQLFVVAALPTAVLAAPAGMAQAGAPMSVPSPTDHEHGAIAGPAAARAGAGVYIILPRDGAVLHSPHVKVLFGAREVGVAPAGVDVPNTGHHHLLVDATLPQDMSEPIPADRNHLHFGAGQTETVLDLPPGAHTLQLLMADGGHVPHNPPLASAKITIHVHAANAPQRVAAR